MEELLTEFVLKGIAFPLAAALVLTGVFRFAFGGARGPALAGAAIGAGFLGAFWLLKSWPPFPPAAATQKIAYLALGGVLLGAVLEGLRAGATLGRLVAVLWPAAIVAWLAWRGISAGRPEALVTAAILWLAGAFVLERLNGAGASGAKSAVMLLAASIGASGVAFIGASASLAQLFGALAAATGGFLLWNWPVPRHPLSGAGLLGGGGAFVALLAATVLFTEASRLALVGILLVFLVPTLVSRSPLGGLGERPAAGPVVVGLASAILVALALGSAFLESGQGF